jgi:sugar phosphate isomerase/epimerase
MLCNVSVNNVPLRDAIPAAAAAGFDVMSITGHSHRRSGMTNEELAGLLARHGVRVQEVEAAFDWLTPIDDVPPVFRPDYTAEELLDIGAALGARTIGAVHFGSRRPVEAAAEAFAALCDRAAARGMDVALEYVAVATIADLKTAWEVVSAADRPNGGLLVDIWHHRRTASADGLLTSIPAERILSVQLSDGPREPVGSVLEDLQHRRFPGEGDFGVPAFVRRLVDHGVSCPFGVETFDPVRLSAGVVAGVRHLHRTLRDVTEGWS